MSESRNDEGTALLQPRPHPALHGPRSRRQGDEVSRAGAEPAQQHLVLSPYRPPGHRAGCAPRRSPSLPECGSACSPACSGPWG